MTSLSEKLPNLLIGLSNSQKLELLALLEEKNYRESGRKLWTYFRDEGDLRRELYKKHLEFFEAGARYKERLVMAGNRVGKTESIGGYETALHLTGQYPSWWVGRRFNKPVRAWVAGKTNETARDIVQTKLFGAVVYRSGKKTFAGDGLIPRDCIGEVTWKQGVQNMADTVQVKHMSGWSIVGIKSYQQGRGSFEGTEREVIWLDEEPPLDIYTESLTRTMTTKGIVMLTFTPLEGTTEVVDDFIHKSEKGIKYLQSITWDDVPHLSKQDKADMLASYPKHEHDARSRGVPFAGSGLIFPIDEADIIIEPFEIPRHFACIGGMDFGWDHPFAAVKLAWDRDKDIVYLIEEYKQSERTPDYHAKEIISWGEWLPWAWPHDGYQHDKGSGIALKEQYEKGGLNMLGENAKFDDGSNGVEAGLMLMLDRMIVGKFKIFSTCTLWLAERRMYHRDKGKIVKVKDDAISASRYALMCLSSAVTAPLNTSQKRSKPNWRRV